MSGRIQTFERDTLEHLARFVLADKSCQGRLLAGLEPHPDYMAYVQRHGRPVRATGPHANRKQRRRNRRG